MLFKQNITKIVDKIIKLFIKLSTICLSYFYYVKHNCIRCQYLHLDVPFIQTPSIILGIGLLVYIIYVLYIGNLLKNKNK